MKLRVFATLAAAGLITSALIAERADATPRPILARFEKDEKSEKKKPKSEAKAAAKDKSKKDEAGGPGELKKRIGLSPRGLRFGMGLLQISQLYERGFDEEFVPLYKKVEPGTRMAALDAELAEKKALIKRNKIEFGRLPTGVDQGPLKGEYSYNNGESMTRVTLRSGTERYFFFFNDKLWKVYDEHRLRKGAALGENYAEAVKNLTKKFGAAPKVVKQDFDKGQNFEEAQWRDNATLIRAMNREPVLAMVYVDRSVQDNLASMRKNKVENPHALDRDVAAVTKKVDPEVDKEKAAKDAKKDDKGAKKKPK